MSELLDEWIDLDIEETPFIKIILDLTMKCPENRLVKKFIIKKGYSNGSGLCRLVGRWEDDPLEKENSELLITLQVPLEILNRSLSVLLEDYRWKKVKIDRKPDTAGFILDRLDISVLSEDILKTIEKMAIGKWIYRDIKLFMYKDGSEILIIGDQIESSRESFKWCSICNSPVFKDMMVNCYMCVCCNPKDIG